MPDTEISIITRKILHISIPMKNEQMVHNLIHEISVVRSAPINQQSSIAINRHSVAFNQRQAAINRCSAALKHQFFFVSPINSVSLQPKTKISHYHEKTIYFFSTLRAVGHGR